MVPDPSLENQTKNESVEGLENPIIAAVVNEMNQRFAILEQPTFLILEEDEDGSFSLDKKQSFKDRFNNKLVDLGNDNKKSKANIFLESSRRRTFRKIVMNPHEVGNYEQYGMLYYNLWKGFAFMPKQGCCERIKEHMYEVICSGNKEHYEYLLNLLSNWVQKPEERTVAILLRGPQGCGKTIFANAIGELFGKAYATYDDVERLLGKFNFDIATKILIFADEALWGGRKSDSGKLKAAITGQTVWIESKGKDKIEIPNYRKFIAASNERLALPLDPDDRRWLVLECSGHRSLEYKYFADIEKELDNGGYAALLYELLHRDISRFNPRQLPANDNAFDLKLQCSSSFLQYMYTCLSEGRIMIGTSNGFPWTEEGILIRTDVLRDHYKDFCTKEKLSLQGDRECGWLLKNLFKETSFKKFRKWFGDVRHPVYVFPQLSKGKECLAAYFRISDIETIFPKDEEALE